MEIILTQQRKKKILHQEERLELLKLGLQDLHSPENSMITQISQEQNSPLRLQQATLEISTCELERDLSFRLADHLQYIWLNASVESREAQQVHLIVGADLIARMNQPTIFALGDLANFESLSHFLVVPRDHIQIKQELEKLSSHRNVSLQVTQLIPQLLPDTLQNFSCLVLYFDSESLSSSTYP